MGDKRCWCNSYDKCIGIIFILTSSVALKSCPGESVEKSLYMSVGQSSMSSFCLTAPFNLLPKVFIDSLSVDINDVTKRKYVTVEAGNSSDRYSLHFHMKNVTKADFTRHSIIAHSNESQIALKVHIKERGLIMYTSTFVDIHYPGNKLQIVCESTDHAVSQIQMFKHRGKNKLNFTVRADKLIYDIKNASCQDMGKYYSKAPNISNSSQVTYLNLTIANCPPVLCDDQSHTITTYIRDTSTPVRTLICVMAYPALTNTHRINHRAFYLHDTPGYRNHLRTKVNYTREGLYYHLVFTVPEVKTEDVATYTVQLNADEAETMALQFNIHLKIMENLPKVCGYVQPTRLISAQANHNASAHLCVAFSGRLNHTDLNVALNHTALRVNSNHTDVDVLSNHTDLRVVSDHTVSSTQLCGDNVCVRWNSSQLSNVTFFYIVVYVRNMKMSMNGELLAEFSVGDEKDHDSSLNFTYLIQPIGPPCCITHLKASFVNQTSALLSWQPGYDGGSEQRFQVTILKEVDIRTLLGIAAVELTSGGLGFTVQDLAPGQVYNLRVIASNIYGAREGCDDTITYKTEMHSNSSPVLRVIVLHLDLLVFTYFSYHIIFV